MVTTDMGAQNPLDALGEIAFGATEVKEESYAKMNGTGPDSEVVATSKKKVEAHSRPDAAALRYLLEMQVGGVRDWC